ncbi:MAG: hypothetical protein PHD39_11930 [Methylobacter tundripaludum]|nr:hypothetical protein [Methylobacter tundripaludum]
MRQQMAMQHRFSVEIFITGQDGLRLAAFHQQTVAPQGFCIAERVGASGLEIIGMDVEYVVPSRIGRTDNPTVGAGLRTVAVFRGFCQFSGIGAQFQYARLAGIENVAAHLEAYRIAGGPFPVAGSKDKKIYPYEGIMPFYAKPIGPDQ